MGGKRTSHYQTFRSRRAGLVSAAHDEHVGDGMEAGEIHGREGKDDDGRRRKRPDGVGPPSQPSTPSHAGQPASRSQAVQGRAACVWPSENILADVPALPFGPTQAPAATPHCNSWKDEWMWKRPTRPLVSLHFMDVCGMCLTGCMGRLSRLDASGKTKCDSDLERLRCSGRI